MRIGKNFTLKSSIITSLLRHKRTIYPRRSKSSIRNPPRASPLHFVPRHKGTRASSPFVWFIRPLCFHRTRWNRDGNAALFAIYTKCVTMDASVCFLVGCTFVCQWGTRGSPLTKPGSSVNAFSRYHRAINAASISWNRNSGSRNYRGRNLALAKDRSLFELIDTDSLGKLGRNWKLIFEYGYVKEYEYLTREGAL